MVPSVGKKGEEKRNPVLEIYFSSLFNIVTGALLLVKGKAVKKRRYIGSGTARCSFGNYSSLPSFLPYFSLSLSIKSSFPITRICLLWVFISLFCPRIPKSITPTPFPRRHHHERRRQSYDQHKGNREIQQVEF